MARPGSPLGQTLTRSFRMKVEVEAWTSSLEHRIDQGETPTGKSTAGLEIFAT